MYNELSEPQVLSLFSDKFLGKVEPNTNPYTALIKLNSKNPVNPIYREDSHYLQEVQENGGFGVPKKASLDKLAQLPEALIISKLMGGRQTEIFASKKTEPKQAYITAQALKHIPTQYLDGKPQLNRYQRKLQGKLLTQGIVYKLLASNPTSKNRKSYLNSLACQQRLIQTGERISTTYCNYRWCVNCNRIRTAKLINSYSAELALFKDPHFVTLTVPNCYGYQLRDKVKHMSKQFSLIVRELREKYNSKIKIFRKIECTINTQLGNANRPDFHPHFHLIVESYQAACLIVDKWLNRFQDAKRQAQDIQPAKGNFEKELFKYFCKTAASSASADKTVKAKDLDRLFSAIRSLRVYQGSNVHKVPEDLNPYELNSQNIKELERSYKIDEETGELLPYRRIYRYCDSKNNYYDQFGNIFEKYTASPKLAATLRSIKIEAPPNYYELTRPCSLRRNSTTISQPYCNSSAKPTNPTNWSFNRY